MSTLYFPQLLTGSILQFPIRKEIQRRTILNRAIGDSAVKMADPEGASTLWMLKYTGLTDTELGQLQELFTATEGRLRDFVWLDPFANLLRWTEDLSEPVWQTSLQTASGIEDPYGRTNACRITNAAQAGQDLTQSVDAPGWYHYSFGFFVRSSSTETVHLRLSNADGTITTAKRVTPEWEHVSVSGQIAGNAEEIRCSIGAPAACAIDVYGLQLDAQRDASAYRKSASSSGVLLARFDQDEFEYVSHGPNNHATQLAVITVRKVST